MKLSSKELKRTAKKHLNGHYGVPMGAFVVTELLVLLVSLPFRPSFVEEPSTLQMVIYFLATFIISLLSSLLSCGLIFIHLNLARGREAKFVNLFSFFTRRPDRILLASLLYYVIFTVLMIPGAAITAVAIIFDSVLWYVCMAFVWIVTFVVTLLLSFSYSLIFYLLIDKPEEKIVDVFRESRLCMRGHKGRLFYLELSFLGMVLLGILSLCIGFLWIVPYMNQTFVEFYRNVMGEISGPPSP